MKKYFIFIAAFLMIFCGCVSNLKTSAWAPISDDPLPFNQSIAKCEYDMQILGKDGERTQFALMGMQHPTFEACMKTLGYAWTKIDNGNVNLQSTPNVTKNKDNVGNVDTKKIEEFRVGIENGDANAEINMAYLYLNGNGVRKSPTQAYKLYLRAAERVDINRLAASNAQVNLGYIYEDGVGVEKDYLRALMWYQISNTTGSEDGRKRYESLSLKSNQLTIRNATRLTNLCVAKNYKSCDDPTTNEWKICEAVNIRAPTQEIAKELSELNLKFAFNNVLKSEKAKLYTLKNYKIIDINDLTKSSEGLFNDKEKYTAYSTPEKNVVVQQFVKSGSLLISIGYPNNERVLIPADCSN